MSVILPGNALVTGGASGIGAATACAFAKAGCAKIALVDKNVEGLANTQQLITELSKNGTRPEVRTYTCDISVAEKVQEVFPKIAKELGRIDYAVNCAGVNGNWMPSTETSPETFDQVNGVNYRGTWLCAREELKIMKTQTLDSEVYPGLAEARAQRGAIVHIASGLGLQAIAGSAAYCGSKAAVISIGRVDALDNSVHRIRVNTVLPGMIDTPMTAPMLEQMAPAVLPRVPMHRFGLADEVADAAVFLCSNQASFIQGAALVVDGGLSMAVTL